MSMCMVCAKHGGKFLQEQTCYLIKDLKAHEEYGDPDAQPPVDPHPRCDFCNERYVDVAALYAHYSEAHFPCQHELCVAEMTVFRTAAELEQHRADVHGEKKVKGQAQKKQQR